MRGLGDTKLTFELRNEVQNASDTTIDRQRGFPVFTLNFGLHAFWVAALNDRFSIRHWHLAERAHVVS